MLKKGHKTNFVFNTIVGGISFAVFSFFTTYSLILPALSTSAEGPSYATSSEVGINVKESIKIAVDKDHLALVDGEGNTQIAPDAAGTLITGDVNVAVTTNAYKGYTVSVYTADSTKAMKHTNTNVSATINSIDTVSGYDSSTGVSDLSANTWGFRKYTAGTPGNWFAVGADSTNAAIIDTKSTPNSEYCDSLEYPLNTSGCVGSTYDTYQVGFGAKLNTALPAGTYTNNIVFSAITNEGTRYLTFNANAPAGATASGSMAPKSVFTGSTVTLPAGGFSRTGYGVKGWALQSGATSVASITDGGNTVALTPGATVSVDALATAAGQSVTATTPIALYAVWDNQYTYSFIANAPAGTVATGSMANGTGVLGLDYTIPANSFEVEGYNFLGWAFSSSASTVAQISSEDVVSGTAFATSALVTAANTAGQSVSTNEGGTVKLYGVWEIGTQYMQDFDCSTLSANEIATLVDNRDNHEYKVKKLPDGKCWMINNLTLSATDLVTEGKALTSANTNIPSSDTNSYYVPPRNTRYATAYSITNSAVATASTSVNFDTNYSSHPQVAYKAKGDTNHNTGNALSEDTAWYPFYTATLGFSYFGDGKSFGSSPRDICPKGWRLPKVSDNGSTITAASSEFANLAGSYNSGASWTNANTTASYYTSDSTIRQNMIKGDASSLDPELDTNGSAGFAYAGYYDSTMLYNVGTSGFYWSSSVYNSSYGYLLYFTTSNVFPQNYNNKYNGSAVRCVAKEPTMQDFNPNSLAEGESTTLVDARDNQEYTVYHIPSTAMYPDTSTIANVAGKVIMTKDLNLGAKASVPGSASTITANGTMTLSPEDSNFTTPTGTDYEGITVPTTSVSITNGSSSWDTSNNNYANKQYTTSGTGDYANRGYYSWGAAMTVCPKGWRLPAQDEYNNNDSSYNASTTGISKLVNNTLSTAQASPWSFVLGGFYNGSFDGAGSYGYYWSSAQNSSSTSYRLFLNSSYGLLRSSNGKYFGLSVRCIAD